MDASLSKRLLKTAVSAALAVGPQLREAFRSGMDVEFKKNLHDLVTAHDKASEETLIAHILAAEPDSRFLGEEGGVSGSGRTLWIIDPIDGTSNFAHGVAFFCVSIAAVVDGEILAGVIYDPVADLLFSADDESAYLNGSILRSAAEPVESRANIMTDYPSAEAIALDGPAALEHFGTLVTTYSTVRRKVSGALELAHVAAGWADGTFGLDTNPWDVAAGILIVRRAGGTYTPFRYDDDERPDFEAPGYVAVGPGGNCPTVLEIVERLMKERRAKGHTK